MSRRRLPQCLSFRIRTLTGSRLWSGLTMAFSGTTFVLGLVTYKRSEAAYTNEGDKKKKKRGGIDHRGEGAA